MAQIPKKTKFQHLKYVEASNICFEENAVLKQTIATSSKIK